MKESHIFAIKAVAIWAFLSLPGNFATFYFFYWESDSGEPPNHTNYTSEIILNETFNKNNVSSLQFSTESEDETSAVEGKPPPHS